MQTLMSSTFQRRLSMPIGALLRPLDPLDIHASIESAARVFRETGSGVLPIADRGEYAGRLRQSDLLEALARGVDPLQPVESIAASGGVAVQPYQSGADALRLLNDTGEPGIVVIDSYARVLGIISPADLFSDGHVALKPRSVGGMATPFGVYLTNGSVSGGAPKWALILTGMLLFGLFFTANAITVLISPWVTHLGLSNGTVDLILSILTFALFMLGLRTIPLAGTHAAEHMTVHAIERDEPLVPSVVARMPRVHPRCGTNIAAGATLFLGIMGSDLVHDQELRLMLAALITLIFWQPLGSFLQYYVTTKPPNRKQIESGIAAGNDLLDKYRSSGSSSTSILGRLWNSGLPEVILGSLAIQLLIMGIYSALGKPGWLGVYL